MLEREENWLFFPSNYSFTQIAIQYSSQFLSLLEGMLENPSSGQAGHDLHSESTDLNYQLTKAQQHMKQVQIVWTVEQS